MQAPRASTSKKSRSDNASRKNAMWLRAGAVAAALLLVLIQPLHGTRIRIAEAGADASGAHDFDFEIGNWKTHIKRLQHPLTGSTTWWSTTERR